MDDDLDYSILVDNKLFAVEKPDQTALLIIIMMLLPYIDAPPPLINDL